MTTDKSADAQSTTKLPDGSGFMIASLPLPNDHWLYAPRCAEWDSDRDTTADTPHPILTNEHRNAVVAAVRYAIRGATMCGQEMDFDPDALVLNAAYALCGPCCGPVEQHEAAPADALTDLVESYGRALLAQRTDEAAAILDCIRRGDAVQTVPAMGSMTLAERIAHVGGRITDGGYVEFGSAMAIDALIKHVLRDVRVAAQAAPLEGTGNGAEEQCKTCGGTRVVDDGEITGLGGVEFENGPVKCVKDCPDCVSRAPRTEVAGAVPGWAQGVEAVAKMIDEKAVDYAIEFGCWEHDTGALSFGQGTHADVKRDYHSSLVELAEEVRAMAAPPSADAAAAPADAQAVEAVATSDRVLDLKTDPEVFAAVLSGAKTHEIRFNDRGFMVGDVLRLRETRYTGQEMRGPEPKPLEYTGREVVRAVSHVLEGYGLQPGWVILSFAPPPPATASAPVGLTEAEILALWNEHYLMGPRWQQHVLAFADALLKGDKQ